MGFALAAAAVLWAALHWVLPLLAPFLAAFGSAFCLRPISMRNHTMSSNPLRWWDLSWPRSPPRAERSSRDPGAWGRYHRPEHSQGAIMIARCLSPLRARTMERLLRRAGRAKLLPLLMRAAWRAANEGRPQACEVCASIVNCSLKTSALSGAVPRIGCVARRASL